MKMKKIYPIGMIFLFLLIFAFTSQGRVMAAEPIRIGFLAPYVGVYTKLGMDMRDGFKLYLDEIKNKVAGREILFFNEDTEGKPDVGPVKTRKLVEKDKVHILAGIIHSGVAYAIRDYVIDKKIPLVITNAGAEKLTKDQRSPYIYRVSFGNGQQDLAGGWYAYAKLGVKKVFAMAPDYSAGHEKANGFMKTFKFMGGEVVQEIYPPLETTDYAPYLAKVADSVGKVDRVWAFFAGSDAIRFITQYDEYGLKQKIKLFVIGDTVDETFLPSQKDTALGVENYLHYAFTLDTPENKRFVKAYQQKYKYDPGQFSEQGYVGAKTIVRAIEAVKGKIEDQAAFMKALKAVKFEAPRGPFKFDDSQNVIENVYIRRVEKKDNQYVNTVFDRVPDVDQFWMPKK
jgi:branched-chain amino acid transport system substrate-binding protein